MPDFINPKIHFSFREDSPYIISPPGNISPPPHRPPSEYSVSSQGGNQGGGYSSPNYFLLTEDLKAKIEKVFSDLQNTDLSVFAKKYEKVTTVYLLAIAILGAIESLTIMLFLKFYWPLSLETIGKTIGLFVTVTGVIWGILLGVKKLIF